MITKLEECINGCMARRGNETHHKDFTDNSLALLLKVTSRVTPTPTIVPITPKHVSLQKTIKGTMERSRKETEGDEEDEEGTEETEEQWGQ